MVPVIRGAQVVVGPDAMIEDLQKFSLD